MVEYIEFRGKKYPIRIAYRALVLAQAETGLTAAELEVNLEAQQTLLWYALQVGAEITKQPHDLKREDMVWMLDENLYDYNRIMDIFIKEMVEGKKKGQGKK